MLSLYFATSIFQKITNIQSLKWTIGIFASLTFGIALLPKNLQQLSFLENTVYKYIILILVIGISLSVLILANIKYLISQKKKGLAILDDSKTI